MVFGALALGAALLSPGRALAGDPGCGEPGDTGMICSAGAGECLSIGPLVCSIDGSYLCKATPGIARVEVCDGKDNDCNGLIDDGLALERPCSRGAGACYATGVFTCTAEGVDVCSAIPGEPQPEICGDGIDSDCDGNLDNGCACLADEDCGSIGMVCDNAPGHTFTCLPGCRAEGGNGCAPGKVCFTPTESFGSCVECAGDSDCGGAQSGRICSTTHSCLAGCRGNGENGCPSALVCSAQGNATGSCVGCMADGDCGSFSSGLICEATACVSGCRLDGSSGCPTGLVCSTSPGGGGACEIIVTGSSSSGDPSGITPSTGGAVSSADVHGLPGSSSSSSSSSSGDPGVVVVVVVPDESTPDGASGAADAHCAMLPGHEPGGAGWIFGAALAALAGLRRRRAA